MEFMSTVADIVQNPVVLTALLAALLAVSEALALIPSIKANSIFQAIANGLKKLAKKD